MESLVPIIIAIVWLILRVVASGKKKQEAARRPMPQGHPQSMPPIRPPAHDPFGKWVQTVLNDEEEEDEVFEAGRKMETPRETPQKEEISIEERLYPSLLDRQARPAAQTEKGTVEKVESQLPQKPAEQAESIASAIASKFDVKKAVIYSEILRPKFEVE